MKEVFKTFYKNAFHELEISINYCQALKYRPILETLKWHFSILSTGFVS